VAIKGKTKRSQSRPGRRAAAGPRIQAVERRLPWYRAPAFPVTLAVVALLGTMYAGVIRTREGFARDDVRRFTEALRGSMAPMAGIVGPGTTAKPGLTTAADLKSGKLKPADLAKRAKQWQSQLEDIRTKVSNVTLGAAGESKLDGNPSNQVGGHVAMLGSVRDAYAAGVGLYFEAAHTYELAASAPAKGPLAGQLVSQGDSIAKRAEQTTDAAASELARLVGRYHLDVTRQMPGESAGSYANRWANAPPPVDSGGATGGQPPG
jgi:hypothetical protein